MTSHDPTGPTGDPPVALVTGAGGTIGAAIAQALAARGATVALTDLDSRRLDGVASGLQQRGHRVVAETVDLRNSTQVTAFVEHVAAELGTIDACVLGAGIEGRVAPVEEVTEEDLASVFDVNVYSMFRLLRSLLPILRKQGGGRVVTIASGAGTGGAPYLSAYVASKHAVVGLTRAVALEEARSGISINAVCPGNVESPMVRRIDDRLARLDRSHGPEGVPMARYADPGEVAELVVFLALAAPAYLTGAAIPIDGGLRV
jgi:NAD(P)-dependent dehydrogenase (short-subunit alcohol dehydrogenase family)